MTAPERHARIGADIKRVACLPLHSDASCDECAYYMVRGERAWEELIDGDFTGRVFCGPTCAGHTWERDRRIIRRRRGHMKRCPTCGRGGRGTLRLPSPALLTLAAEEVARGEDMDAETIGQLVLLRRALSAAAQTVDSWISYRARLMAGFDEPQEE